MFKVLQSDRLEARKNHETVRTNLLSCLIADIQRKVHSNPPDVLISETAKKFVEAAKEVIQFSKDELTVTNAKIELSLLEKYIMDQFSEEKLEVILRDSGLTTMKEMMSLLKTEYAGLYDGKIASQVATRIQKEFV